MTDNRKSWCAWGGDNTACDCREGECLMAQKRETLAPIITLLQYGLTPQEVAQDLGGDEGEHRTPTEGQQP